MNICEYVDNVDATNHTTLVHSSGRVKNTDIIVGLCLFVHAYGIMYTLALVRLPPTATKAIN